MSNPWNGFALGLAAHLREEVAECAVDLPEMERIEVVVWRQDDLNSLADGLTAKAKGMGVIILGCGGKNPDPKSNALRVGGAFSISVWASPDIVTDLKADDLCWKLARAAQGFKLFESPTDRDGRLEVEDVAIVPHKKFLVWEAKANVLRLPQDESTAPPGWQSETGNWET